MKNKFVRRQRNTRNVIVFLLLFTCFFGFGCAYENRLPDQRSLQELKDIRIDIRTSRDYIINMPLSEKVPMGRFPLDAVTEININALNSILEEVPDPVINIKRIDLASNDPAYQIDDQSNTSRDRDFFERQNIRQLLSPKLNQTLDSDAILWVYITYTLDQDNPDLRVGHFINLQISVTAELYDQTGKKIWIDATRKTFPGGIIFGSWKATSPSGNSFEFDIDENLVRDISQSAMPSMLKSIQQSLFAQIKKEVDSN